MKKSRGTEIKLDDLSHINVVFGTTDKNNPKTIYIKLSAWGNPIGYKDDIDYKKVIRKIDKKIRTLLYKELDGILFNDNVYFVDMDMRESGIINDKSSFMSCEITLRQKNHYLLNSDLINNELNKLSSKIIKNVFLENEFFEFYRSKKIAKLKLKQSLII